MVDQVRKLLRHIHITQTCHIDISHVQHIHVRHTCGERDNGALSHTITRQIPQAWTGTPPRCTHVCLPIDTHTYMHTCMYIYIHTYKQTNIYTYIHAYIHTRIHT